MTTLVNLTIDGRTVRAPAGSYVLQVAREAGIEIPTLCDHPALEPVGACRLCLVEVTHPDWKGWSGLMTSCLYPVEEGIQVSTSSARVRDARRQVLTLLAARCPSSAAIRKLAEQHGCDTTLLQVDPNADNCIVCGLCTRVCESYATAAITTVSRGATKAVGSFEAQPPEECVGCGACAQVCPTDNIPASRTGADFRIWQRTFPTFVATVDPKRCTACGSCEEACPFAVARVVFAAAGHHVASIPAEQCRGCGACVGACPSGAIDQKTYEWKAMLEPVPSFSQGGAS
ncbi:MAG: 4Fe-4S dicluster domain-containing protein [Deltaproteobacteria bacterium]|nr:4Fe-4S dicluster domain-containing protein [Deltaproteobacteria bacterium]